MIAINKNPGTASFFELSLDFNNFYDLKLNYSSCFSFSFSSDLAFGPGIGTWV